MVIIILYYNFSEAERYEMRNFYLTPSVPLYFKGEGEYRKEGLRPS
jgi:hypothetical protein